jgi:hypothetical protein
MPTKLHNPEDANLIDFSIQRQNAIRSSEASNKTKQINTKISVLTDFLIAATPDEFRFNKQFKSLERKSTID